MNRKIVLEGLPGGGKTSMSAWLAEQMDYLHLPEHIFKKKVFDTNLSLMNDSEDIYFLHWETKHAIHRHFNLPYVADRNHLTTLAYNYSKSKITKDPSFFNTTLSWYKTCILKNKLEEPNIYFITDIPPELCNHRKQRMCNEELLWTQEKALEHSGHFYSIFEKLLFHTNQNPPLIFRLNANRDTEIIKKEILSLATDVKI